MNKKYAEPEFKIESILSDEDILNASGERDVVIDAENLFWFSYSEQLHGRAGNCPAFFVVSTNVNKKWMIINIVAETAKSLHLPKQTKNRWNNSGGGK